MNIVAIVVTLLIVMILILVMTNLLSKSRNTSDFYHTPHDGTPYHGYSASSGDDRSQASDQGDWGGRHVSYENDAGYDSDSGGGGDSGGDAGGGEGGGGGE